MAAIKINLSEDVNIIKMFSVFMPTMKETIIEILMRRSAKCIKNIYLVLVNSI